MNDKKATLVEVLTANHINHMSVSEVLGIATAVVKPQIQKYVDELSQEELDNAIAEIEKQMGKEESNIITF